MILLKPVFFIAIAFVFTLFAISLAIIPADAVDYRFGTDFGSIFIGDMSGFNDFW